MPFVKADMNKEREMMEELRKDPKIDEYARQLEMEYNLKRSLAKAKKERKMTTSDICNKTGLTKQTISRLEKNDNVSTLVKYLSALDYEIVIQPQNRET